MNFVQGERAWFKGTRLCLVLVGKYNPAQRDRMYQNSMSVCVGGFGIQAQVAAARVGLKVPAACSCRVPQNIWYSELHSEAHGNMLH